MRVLLIDPVYNPGVIPPNLSLGKIEAVLTARGVDSAIVDFVDPQPHPDLSSFRDAENAFIENIVEESRNATIVYITSSVGFELKPYPIFPRIRSIADRLKRTTNPRVVVGGAFTNYLQNTLDLDPEVICGSSIDHLVSGDEIGLLRITDGLDYVPANNVLQGITWNSLNFNKYPPLASLLTMTGCLYKCDFCFEGKMYDPKNDAFSAYNAIRTARDLNNKHGINRFAIEDSTLLANPYFEYVCDSLKSLGASFTVYGRINEILKYPERISLLKTAGCSSIIVGIETPDDIMLKRMKKGIRLDNILRAVNIVHAQQMRIQGCFMAGLYGDGCSETERTIDFAHNLELFAYRWHIYQPNLRLVNSHLVGGLTIEPHAQLAVQTNFPDNCLPEIIDQSPPNILLDEHFLIRAIPYLSRHPLLKTVGYRSDFMFDQLYDLLSRKLLPKQDCFNEEEMYRLV